MIGQIETKRVAFDTIRDSDDINEQEENKITTDYCEQGNKCEPRSLHITCGYPAANPNSNPIAYCNELTHYIKCAKCKILNCKLEDNVITIRKHLNGLEIKHDQKCEQNKYVSKTPYPQTSEPEIETISTTLTTTSEYLSSTLIIPESFYNKETYTTTQIQNSTSQLRFDTSIIIESTTDFITSSTTKLIFEEITSTVKTTLISSTVSTTKTTAKSTSTSLKTTSYSTSTKSHITNTPNRIGFLKIDFDFISKGNLKVLTNESEMNFKVIAVNQTDIFRGLINGAASLNSCNGFLIDLNNYDTEFCISSDGTNCAQGWTVSFWLKKVNSNNFDKNIFDNFKNNSNYLSIRISESELIVKFVNQNKLWSISQNFRLVEKEWTMFTFTWTDFEGLVIYINNRKLSYKTEFIQLQNNYFRKENILSNMNIGLSNYGSMASVKIGFENLKKRSECYINSNQSSYDSFILIDEMTILNHKLTNREIAANYLKGIPYFF